MGLPQMRVKLGIYVDDDTKLLIGDLSTNDRESEELRELHEMAEAAAGDDILGMVYTRSNVPLDDEDPDKKDIFGSPGTRILYGTDVKANIRFYRTYAELPDAYHGASA